MFDGLPKLVWSVVLGQNLAAVRNEAPLCSSCTVTSHTNCTTVHYTQKLTVQSITLCTGFANFLPKRIFMHA